MKTSSPQGRIEHAAASLAAWGEAREWLGPDPFEAMNSPVLRAVARTPGAQARVAGLYRRSPVDLSRALLVRPRHNAAALARLHLAYSLLGRADRAAWALGLLEERAVRSPAGSDGPEPPGAPAPAGFGYPFPVRTAPLLAEPGAPNAVCTAICGHALLEAAALTGDGRPRDLGLAAAAHLATRNAFHRDATDPEAGWFAYYAPGDPPVHNVNLLSAALVARAVAADGRADPAWLDRATAATRLSLDSQQPEGGFPYREGSTLVDTAHNGYIADALGVLARDLPDPELAGRAADSRARLLEAITGSMVAPDGAVHFGPGRPRPVDGQAVAQTITTLTLIADVDPGHAAVADRIANWAIDHLRRSDGAFTYRLLASGRRVITPHVRWVQAPMLEALARLITAEEKVE